MTELKKWNAEYKKVYLARVNLIFASLFLLLLPFNNRYFTMLIVPWFLVATLYAMLEKISVKEVFNKSLWFIIFYGITLFSLLYSKDFIKGIKTLEIMSSFLIMPFLATTLKVSLAALKRNTNQLINLYIIGLALYIVVSVVALFLKWDSTMISEYFETQTLTSDTSFARLSFFQNRIYISMFMVWGIVLILNRNFKTTDLKIPIVGLIVTVLFASYIVLLGSRAGMITLLFVILFYVWRFFHRFSPFVSVSVTCIVFTFLVFALNKYTRVGETIRQVEIADMDAGDNRIPLWKDAWEGIKESPVFGYGIGDGLNILVDIHKKNNIESAYEAKANAHNQFLETMLHTGIPGLLSLAALLLIPFVSSIRQKHELLFVLVVIIFTNLLFESMLIRLSGVLFTGFWISFLCITGEIKTLKEDCPLS